MQPRFETMAGRIGAIASAVEVSTASLAGREAGITTRTMGGTGVTVLGLEAAETRLSTAKAATEGGKRSDEGVQADPRCADGADWTCEARLPAPNTDSG